jgi:hypothetical protein
MTIVKYLALIAALLIAAAPGVAQVEDGGKITVALSDPSRPAFVKASLMNGSITVKGYGGKEVIVEAKDRPGSDIDETDEAEETEERSERDLARRKGMRRITSNASTLSVEEDNNEVTVGTGWRGMSKTLDLVIQVPANSSLKLNTMNDGGITVTGVNGEIEVSNMNGPISVRDVSGAVVADAMNADIDVTFTGVDAKKSSSFSSMNGDIDVTFPSSARATLKMKSDMGEIYSDFEMKLEDRTTKSEENRKGKGRYKITLEKVMTGTLNGGGPEITFKNFNGDIFIRKGK